MYNVIFETEPANRQNIFNESNPIILMMIQEFNMQILESHIFYKVRDEFVSEEILRMIQDGDNVTEHQIESMNVTTFGEDVFKVMHAQLNTSLVGAEIFDPLIISGTYYSTDKVRSSLNAAFLRHSKLLSDYNLVWSAMSMLDFGFSSEAHIDRVIIAGLDSIKPEDFEDNIDGRAYKKAIITQPERRK